MTESRRRVIGIELYSRGYGFAVLEGATRLVDRGLVQVRPWSQKKVVERLKGLLVHYRPDTVALEDLEGTRKGKRVRKAHEAMVAMAQEEGVEVRTITRRDLLEHFGAETRYELACAVVERFPELRPHLPPPRKPWESEDERLKIFLALSRAFAGAKPSQLPQ